MLKKSVLWFVFIIAGLSFCGCAMHEGYGPIRTDEYSGPIKVACVGDSITYGSGIEDRETNSYPAQLGRMLGDKWDVRNFGVGGATLLKKGDKPYWGLDAFNKALEFRPDVVVIKLGTNDTKPHNWQYEGEYMCDYSEMIAKFRAVNSDVRIWLCLPVPAFPERWGISDDVIREEVVPMVRQVANIEGLPVIDLYRALSGRSEFFPDRIHPNAAGAKIMAFEIYRALADKPDKNIIITMEQEFSWHN